MQETSKNTNGGLRGNYRSLPKGELPKRNATKAVAILYERGFQSRLECSNLRKTLKRRNILIQKLEKERENDQNQSRERIESLRQDMKKKLLLEERSQKLEDEAKKLLKIIASFQEEAIARQQAQEMSEVVMSEKEKKKKSGLRR